MEKLKQIEEILHQSNIAEILQQKTKSSLGQEEITSLNTQTSLHDWVLIPEFKRRYPNFSTPIKWLLLHRHSNGLSEHCRLVGRRLYLSIPGFLHWIENQAQVKR